VGCSAGGHAGPPKREREHAGGRWQGLAGQRAGDLSRGAHGVPVRRPRRAHHEARPWIRAGQSRHPAARPGGGFPAVLAIQSPRLMISREDLMTNDVVPGALPSGLAQFIEKLNLPELIAGPAGRAISRLVAGVIEIPASYLDSFAQAVKDKTSAKSLVSNAVAEAAAKLAANDDAVVKRAAHNLLAKEYRHQRNKEAIAVRTIELLKESEQQDQAFSTTSPPDADADWLNVFERYAEDASSERLQGLWARVLAGEIRKPKSFSLPTLRFISELEADVATLFEKYAPEILTERIIHYPYLRAGPEFTHMLALEQAGLISFSSGTLGTTFALTSGANILSYKTHAISIYVSESITINIPQNAPLTKIGREIYSILSPGNSIEHARAFASQLPKHGISSITYGKINRPGSADALFPIEELWRSTT
jgi:Protein of unknown function (DUF2806)